MTAPPAHADTTTSTVLVYTGVDSNKVVSVHYADIDGTHDRTVVQNAADGVLSPDGTRLAYDDLAHGTVVVADSDGANPTTVSDLTTIDSTHGDFAPSWSPDGKQLAYEHVTFDADAQPTTATILRYDVAAKTILTVSADAASPAWGSNNRIAAAVRLPGIVTMAPTGDDVHTVVSGLNDLPAWNPAADHITFTHLDMTTEPLTTSVFVTDLTGGTPTKLADQAEESSFSPDGTQVYFVDDTSPNRVCHVQASDGTGRACVTTAAGNPQRPTVAKLVTSSTSTGGGTTTTGDTSVSNVSVVPSSNLAGDASVWTWTFTPTHTVPAGGNVELHAPANTVLPAFAGSYLVNGVGGAALVAYNGAAVRFTTPVTVSAGFPATITVNPVVNPAGGTYGAGTFAVLTSADPVAAYPAYPMTFQAPATSTTTSTASSTGGFHTTVVGGETVSSDPAGSTPDAAAPIIAFLTGAAPGDVSFQRVATPDPRGYRTLALGMTVSAQPTTSAQPMALTFQVRPDELPGGVRPEDVVVLRNGAPLPRCTVPGVAVPDPCVAGRDLNDSVFAMTVLTSQTAHQYDLAVPVVLRVAGSGRIETAIEASRSTYPTGGAHAVVLARSDNFPDALAGIPLAAAKDAPLLLTPSNGLDGSVENEVRRVLAPGNVVYLLGGERAIAPAVAARLSALGYQVVRLGGADRYETAVIVADRGIGPTKVAFEATGTDFADALSAGAAAAHLNGVVLLTQGSTQAASTANWLTAHPGVARYAIGDPSAAADRGAVAIAGVDRYQTSALVAQRFFSKPSIVGIATGQAFPDALAGGAHAATWDGPLLLVPSSVGVPATVSTYLRSVAPTLDNAFVFGGTAAVGSDVQNVLATLLP